MMTEAYWPKVHNRALRREELAGIDIYQVVGISMAGEAKALAWLNLQVQLGTSYDILDLFRFSPVFRAILKEPKIDPMNRRTFCSMLVQNATVEGKWPLFNAPDYCCSPGLLPWSPRAKYLGQLDIYLASIGELEL